MLRYSDEAPTGNGDYVTSKDVRHLDRVEQLFDCAMTTLGHTYPSMDFDVRGQVAIAMVAATIASSDADTDLVGKKRK